MPAMYMPQISTANDAFTINPIAHGGDAATIEYLRLNQYGFHLKALRRLPLLWDHALHEAGGMQPRNLVQMMKVVAAEYENFTVPYGVPDSLGGDAAWHTQVPIAFDGFGDSLSLMDLYVLGHFAFESLAAADIEPLYHLFGGRY